MDCAQVRERISEWLDGEILPAGRAELERHLAACAACRAEGEALSAVSRTLRALPRKAAPPGIAREVRERLAREQLIGPGAPGARRRRLFLPRWMKGMGLAAAALLVVVSVGDWGGRLPPEEDAEALRSPSVELEIGRVAEPTDGEKLGIGDAQGLSLKDAPPALETAEPLPEKLDDDKIPDGVRTGSIDRLSDGPQEKDPPGSAGGKGSLPSTRSLEKAKEIQEEAWDERFEDGSFLGKKGRARAATSPERDQDDPPLGRQRTAAPIEVCFSVPDDGTLERVLALARAEAPEDKNRDLKKDGLRSLGYETEGQEQPAQREEASSLRVVERVLTADELARLLADLERIGAVPDVSWKNLASPSASSSEKKKDSSAPRTYRLVFEVTPGAGR